MFRITEALSLGLHAMKSLAGSPHVRLSTGVIARELSFSEAHLAKVFQALGRAGLVKSTRGPAGGFRLSRPATDISLLEIVEGVDGMLGTGRCPFNLTACRGEPCVLGRQLMKQRKEMKVFLAGTSLAQYAGRSVSRRPGKS